MSHRAKRRGYLPSKWCQSGRIARGSSSAVLLERVAAPAGLAERVELSNNYRQRGFLRVRAAARPGRGDRLDGARVCGAAAAVRPGMVGLPAARGRPARPGTGCAGQSPFAQHDIECGDWTACCEDKPTHSWAATAARAVLALALLLPPPSCSGRGRMQVAVWCKEIDSEHATAPSSGSVRLPCGRPADVGGGASASARAGCAA